MKKHFNVPRKIFGWLVSSNKTIYAWSFPSMNYTYCVICYSFCRAKMNITKHSHIYDGVDEAAARNMLYSMIEQSTKWCIVLWSVQNNKFLSREGESVRAYKKKRQKTLRLIESVYSTHNSSIWNWFKSCQVISRYSEKKDQKKNKRTQYSNENP